MDFVLLMDQYWSIQARGWTDIFPHRQDVQSSRPIRSQTPVLIPAGEVEGPVLSLSIPLRFTQDKLVEGLYPLSYGCVV